MLVPRNLTRHPELAHAPEATWNDWVVDTQQNLNAFEDLLPGIKTIVHPTADGNDENYVVTEHAEIVRRGGEFERKKWYVTYTQTQQLNDRGEWQQQREVTGFYEIRGLQRVAKKRAITTARNVGHVGVHRAAAQPPLQPAFEAVAPTGRHRQERSIARSAKSIALSGIACVFGRSKLQLQTKQRWIDRSKLPNTRSYYGRRLAGA